MQRYRIKNIGVTPRFITERGVLLPPGGETLVNRLDGGTMALACLQITDLLAPEPVAPPAEIVPPCVAPEVVQALAEEHVVPLEIVMGELPAEPPAPAAQPELVLESPPATEPAPVVESKGEPEPAKIPFPRKSGRRNRQ